jgi:hypothetical protein
MSKFKYDCVNIVFIFSVTFSNFWIGFYLRNVHEHLFQVVVILDGILAQELMCLIECVTP